MGTRSASASTLLAIACWLGLAGSALAAGQLFVTSRPSGATVVLDGRAVGSTPWRDRNLPAGTHVLTLEQQGYRTVHLTLPIVDGLVTHRALVLPRHVPLAQVWIRSWPEGARVFLDGRPMGRTPIRFKAPPGRCLVTLEHPGFRVLRRRLVLYSDLTTVSHLALHSLPVPRIVRGRVPPPERPARRTPVALSHHVRVVVHPAALPDAIVTARPRVMPHPLPTATPAPLPAQPLPGPVVAIPATPRQRSIPWSIRVFDLCMGAYLFAAARWIVRRRLRSHGWQPDRPMAGADVACSSSPGLGAYLQGVAWHAQGLPMAQVAYHVALYLDPGLREARYNLALHLAADGQLLEARLQYTALLAMHPRDAEAWFNLGNLHHRLGDDRQARAAFRRARRGLWRDRAVRINMALCHGLAVRPSKARMRSRRLDSRGIETLRA